MLVPVQRAADVSGSPGNQCRPDVIPAATGSNNRPALIYLDGLGVDETRIPTQVFYPFPKAVRFVYRLKGPFVENI